MTPAARAEASRLLQSHPDEERWRRFAKQEEDSPRLRFMNASTWADEIRNDLRFFTPGDTASTPLLRGYPDMARHADWHSEARRLDARAPSRPNSLPTGRLGEALTALVRLLGESRPSASERAYALVWLIHLVGDAHQPLHLSLRQDAGGLWDWLGTGYPITDLASTHKPFTTLHAFWDDLPGPVWLRGKKLDETIDRLIALQPVMETASNTTTPAIHRWLDESWELARDFGYPESQAEDSTLSETFRAQSRTIALQQVTKAGYRLGHLLNRLLAARTPLQ